MSSSVAVVAAGRARASNPDLEVHSDLEPIIARLLSRARIAVVYGGDKTAGRAVIHQSANFRSWKSYEPVARDIANALSRIGWRTVRLMPDDMTLPARLRREKIDLVWLNSGGVQGHASVAHAAATLELAGIPYVGHDPLTAALLDNKPAFNRMMPALGIANAPSFAWHPFDGPEHPSDDPRFPAFARKATDGFIVKPASGRGSLNVHFARTAKEAAELAREVHDLTHGSVLIEAFLPGREYCIAVCGPTIARDGHIISRSSPFAFAPIERVLAPDEPVFTSMDVRPITGDRVRLLNEPADESVIEELNRIAKMLYRRLPLRSLVRLDVRADAKGELKVLEANPKPDLKAPGAASTSIIGAGLARHGLAYDDLILSLLADRIAQMRRMSPEALTRLLGK